MRVEIVDQDGSGIRADPVTIAPEESTVSMEIQMPIGQFTGTVPIKFRAVGQLPGYVNIISETDVTLVDADSR